MSHRAAGGFVREKALRGDLHGAIVDVSRERDPGARVTTQAVSDADKQTLLEELTREHRRLDDLVRELERKVALSPAEQVEYSRLKKRKLWTKDRIARLRA
jgi:uncharacterized protein YdcH (DUF465 family)